MHNIKAAVPAGGRVLSGKPLGDLVNIIPICSNHSQRPGRNVRLHFGKSRQSGCPIESFPRILFAQKFLIANRLAKFKK